MAVFSQVSWQGWITNDEYLTDSTQFSDCEDVNIYESSGYFKLWPAKTSTTLLTSSAWYYGSYTFTKYSGTKVTWLFGNKSDWVNWAIADSASPDSPTYTSGKGTIRNMWVVTRVFSWANPNQWKWFIITSKWGLYRWDFDADVWSYWNFTDAWLTSVVSNATQETNYAPYILRGWILFYWYMNIVRCIDTTVSPMIEVPAEWTSSWPILTLSDGYEITNMFLNGTQIVIYANNGTHSKKYFWDGVSDSFSDYTEFHRKKIVNVANFGNYEISLYQNDNQYNIGYVSWYDMKPIFSSDMPASNTIRWFQTFIANSLWSLCYGDNLMGFVRDSSSIYVLWNFKPQKPLSLSRFSHSMDGTINHVSWDGYFNTLYSWLDSSHAYKLAFSNSTFDSAWYIITNPIRGKALSIKKSSKKVMYWYELQTWSTIKIYYQFDKNETETGSANWTLLDTITVWSDFDVWNGYRVVNIDWKFNQARFKIQLETSNSSYSPKLFDFHFEYDETNAEL